MRKLKLYGELKSNEAKRKRVKKAEKVIVDTVAHLHYGSYRVPVDPKDRSRFV